MNTLLFEVIKQAIKAKRTTLASCLDTLRSIENDAAFEDSLKSVLFDLDNTQNDINDILSLYYRESDVCDIDPEATTTKLLEEDAK